MASPYMSLYIKLQLHFSTFFINLIFFTYIDFIESEKGDSGPLVSPD